jgi:hypothetical protein
LICWRSAISPLLVWVSHASVTGICSTNLYLEYKFVPADRISKKEMPKDLHHLVDLEFNQLIAMDEDDEDIELTSGNRKDLKCVVCRLWSVVRGPWSVSIDSHVQYISFSFYTIVKLTQYITFFSFIIT